MGDLGRFSSDDMDYSHDKEALDCKIITMESMVSMVLTSAPTNNHGLTNNPPHCVDTNNNKAGMDYFLKKEHSGNDGKWGITYNVHYKVINEKEYNVKYRIIKFITQHLEYAHGGQNFVLSVTFQDGTVTTQNTHTLHLEIFVLRRNIKEFVVNPK